MKQAWKNSIPALLSIIVFLIVATINALGNVPVQQRENFEIFSNAFMFAIAIISFLTVGLPSQKSNGTHLGNLLGNIAISATAFPMNISVFGHAIQWTRLLDDLWGWHLWWILFAVIQVLFLSNLGKTLLDQAGKILTGVTNIMKPLGNVFSGLRTVIENGDKGIVLIIIGTFILWIIYLAAQIRDNGLRIALSDTNILWGSVRLWIVCILIGFLLYLVPSIYKKSKEAIQYLNGKWLLPAMIMVIILLLFAYVFPDLLKTVKIVIVMVATLAVLIWFVAKSAHKHDKDNSGRDDRATKNRIKHLDLVVILVAFFVIPLTTIGIATVFSPTGNEIISTQNPTELTTWLNFMEAAMGVAQNITQLFF